MKRSGEEEREEKEEDVEEAREKESLPVSLGRLILVIAVVLCLFVSLEGPTLVASGLLPAAGSWSDLRPKPGPPGPHAGSAGPGPGPGPPP